MSRTNVIVALVVALLLAAATVYVTSTTAPSTDTDRPPGLDFSPASVAELHIARPDGRVFRVVRAADPGEWRLHTEVEGGGWPVLATPVRAGLRLLSMLTLDGGRESPAPLGEDAATVTVVLEDRTRRTVRLGSRQLAGRVAAEMQTPAGVERGWVGTDIADAFVASGPLHWRDPAALPLAGPETSRVRLSTGSQTIELARVQGRWSLREPLAAPAEPEAVGKLIAALASARIADFLDDPATLSASAGVDQPSASAVLESDRRVLDGGDVRTRTVRNELHIGSTADLSGTRLYARVARTGEGADGEVGGVRRVVVVEAGLLASLSTDPAGYVSRSTLEVPAAEVAEMRLALAGGEVGAAFRRTFGEWARIDDGGSTSPVAAQVAAGIGRFLKLLTEDRAATVALHRPDGFEQVGSLIVLDLAGDGMAEIELGVKASEGGKPSLVTRVDSVWRTYTPEASEPLLWWLADLGG